MNEHKAQERQSQGGPPRDNYSDAGKAFRSMRQRLVAVKDKLPPNDLLVALPVSEYLLSWSKVADRVTRDQIAQAAGCHAQTAGRALTRLARLGVLTWVPATHKGGASRLSMDPPDTTVVSGQATAPETTVVSSLDTAVVSLPRSSAREEEILPQPPKEPTASDVAEEKGEIPEIIDDEGPPDPEFDQWCVAAQGVIAIAKDFGIEHSLSDDEVCIGSRLWSSDRRRLVRQVMKIDPALSFEVMLRASSQGPYRGHMVSPVALIAGRVNRAHDEVRAESAAWSKAGEGECNSN